ncbi:MAG: TonB-dependent receptor [Gammaproteobacteria bacterium]
MLRTNTGRRHAFAAAAAAILMVSTPVLADQARDSGRAEEDALEEVLVTASQVRLLGEFAGGQVARGGRAGLLGNLDIMDAPFSSTSYTADLILDQQAESVADVLLNDPVVRVARGFGNFQELYVIRGFPAFSDDMTYNGIYGILPRQFVAAEFLERVEVFRGATAFLNGAAPGGSSLGGLVNLVPKRAPRAPLKRATLGFENDGQAHVALDIARRFGTDEATGIRANALRRDGESSVKDQEPELTVLSFGVDHQGETLRLSADIGFQDRHIDAPRPSVTPASAIPAPPDADANFAQPWTFTDEKQLFAVARGEYDLGANTTAWLAAGFRDGEEENDLANPTAQPDGSSSAFRFHNVREDDIRSGDIGIRTEFDTGGVGHRLILSGSIVSFELNNAFDFYFTPTTSNLYTPVASAPPTGGFIFSGGLLGNPLLTEDTQTQSIAIADMLSFADDRFLLTIGARHQTIETETFDFSTGASLSNYDESRVTPVAGLVYKPSESLSLYGNYIEGLSPGGIAPATSGGQPVLNAGEAFEPAQTDQVEIGIKYDSGSVGLTAAVFDLSRPFSVIENQRFSIGGEQRHRGVELSAFGELRPDVRLIGGLTWLDPEMSRTQGGVNEGNDPVGVPELQANVNVEWDPPVVEGLTVDARAIYTSDQFADAANTVEVSSWTRLDVGARYGTSIAERPVTYRLRIDNVTDESDWISVGGFPGSNYLVLGSPRTFVLSASVDF